MLRALRRAARWFLIALCVFYGIAALAMLFLRFFDPPTTTVQMQRRVEAWLAWEPYDKRSDHVPLQRISPALQHAVLAAEDGRFYQHHGLDWFEMQKVAKDSQRKGRITRGASTITQQLVKNLFLTTHASWVRKVLEIPLALLAEVILPKQRILELYLNVIEWGPGVYGAEAAARYHFGVDAANIGREQSARLAAILPSPRKRKPQRMNLYSQIILERMADMGW